MKLKTWTWNEARVSDVLPGEWLNLRDVNLRGANLRGANLWGADLENANLERANLRGADLRRANLRRANLRRANLRGADLLGADVGGANLGGANLEGAKNIPALMATFVPPQTGAFDLQWENYMPRENSMPNCHRCAELERELTQLKIILAGLLSTAQGKGG